MDGVALRIQHRGHQRLVFRAAAAQHHGHLPGVEAHEGARRVEPHHFHQRMAHVVAAGIGTGRGDGAGRVGCAATGTGLAGADHGSVAVHGVQHRRQPRGIGGRAAGGGFLVVAVHDVQPEGVGDAPFCQQRAAMCRVGADGGLLGRGGALLLQGQRVLQMGHGDVHRHGGAYQAGPVFSRQGHLDGRDVAQGCTHQCMRGAVADGGGGSQLEQQVQRGIGVLLQQGLHPVVVLRDLAGEILHAGRVAQQNAHARFEIRPQAQQILVTVVVDSLRHAGGVRGVHRHFHRRQRRFSSTIWSVSRVIWNCVRKLLPSST